MSTFPTRQARIEALVLYLAGLKQEEIVTHKDLVTKLGIDVRVQRDYTLLYEARRRATTDYDVVLVNIRGVGYMRVGNEDLAKDRTRLRRIHGQSRRGLDEIAAVDARQISQGAQAAMAVRALILADVNRRTGSRTVTKQIKLMANSPSGGTAVLAGAEDARNTHLPTETHLPFSLPTQDLRGLRDAFRPPAGK